MDSTRLYMRMLGLFSSLGAGWSLNGSRMKREANVQ